MNLVCLRIVLCVDFELKAYLVYLRSVYLAEFVQMGIKCNDALLFEFNLTKRYTYWYL